MSHRINAVVTDEKFNFIESVSKGNRSFVISEGLEALYWMYQIFGGLWLTESKNAANIADLFSGSLTEAQEARRALDLQSQPCFCCREGGCQPGCGCNRKEGE